MANTQIKVGYEYKNAFESICKLISGGCLDKNKYKVSAGVISDGVYDYVLSTEDTVKEDENKFRFTKKGASWFKALRGEKVDNQEAIWTNFIQTVAMDYHLRYSVFEYSNLKRTKEDIKRLYDKCSRFVADFIDVFYPRFKSKYAIKQIENQITEDIYGATMRLDLSGGTGASVPIITKVYFNKVNDFMEPVRADIAYTIDESITSIIPDDNEDTTLELPSESVDTVLTAIDNLVNSETDNFANYICCSTDDDVNAINGMLDRLAHEDFKLECQHVDLLNISHVKSLSYACDVYLGVDALFRFLISIDGTFTVSCLKCNDKKFLINRNTVETIDDEGNATTYILNVDEKNFGLTDQELALVKQTSEISKHLIDVTCQSTVRSIKCNGLKCAAHLGKYMVNGKEVLKCRECPYPEIIYRNREGDLLYTPVTIFVKDKNDLVLNENVKYCPVCGRAVTKEHFTKNNGRCSICNKLLSGNCDNNGELYSKYKGILPLATRFFNLFSKKACIEDDEVIMFIVGKSVYLFNKLNLKEKGLIKGVKKVYVRR